jgi:hypothetical protein
MVQIQITQYFRGLALPGKEHVEQDGGGGLHRRLASCRRRSPRLPSRREEGHGGVVVLSGWRRWEGDRERRRLQSEGREEMRERLGFLLFI